MSLPFRPTIRLRLTIIYTLLFVVAGVALVAITYVLVRNALAQRITRLVLVWGGRVDFNQLGQAQHQLQDAVLHELLVQSATALVATAALAVVLGWVVAGRALRPVRRITAAARRLSEETLDQRIGMSGPKDELKELGDTFDAMLDRLQAAFDSQRRFVANASHELRTPLAVQRTLIDVALRSRSPTVADLMATLRELGQVVDGNERLIEGLLLLASSQRGLERRETVSLKPLALQAMDRLRPQAERRRVSFTPSVASVTVEGDAVLLQRLVENLVENAVRHNLDGGWAELKVGETDGLAIVEASSTGHEIPREEVLRLFEPFHRYGSKRTARGSQGLGLGLSIVRAVAEAHDGFVTAEPREGGGLTVTVTLPREGHWRRH